jgi:hypothetical protein
MYMKHIGIDYDRFTREGLPVEELNYEDDEILFRLVASAKARNLESERVLIQLNDTRTAKLCARGVREFFKKHDLDWPEALANGIDVSKLEHIDDPLLKKAIKAAKERTVMEIPDGQ